MNTIQKVTVISPSTAMSLRQLRSVRPLAVAAAAALAALAQMTHAQSSVAAAPKAEEASDTTTISVTGSRVNTRVLSESATPVDLVRRDELLSTGQLQLQNALAVTVPSFSVSKPSTAGALDFTSSPTLRGLGPGDLLLMVNGKRRHSTAALNLNNQIGRGDVGYDFNTLPPLAIGRVEVLRDGASAIYGADAVAGVINVILDKSMDRIASFTTGVTSKGDGFNADASLGFGIKMGESGVLRTTVRLQEREKSNRADFDTRQQYFGTNSATGAKTGISGNFGSGTGLTPSSGTLDPREATFDRNTHWLGDSPFTAASMFVNGEVPLASGSTLYTFGGFSKLYGESQGFFRRPGDDRTVRALHPDGFRPYPRSDFGNMSLAAGVKGDNFGGFAWDVSTLLGSNSLDDSIHNSNNASLGAASPKSAFVGGYRFTQWTNNLDLSREISLGGSTPARLAMGAELRREQFESIAGEPDSYRVGGAAILDGPNAGRAAPVGMQMLPGLTPDDAIKASRRSV
ncbi:MAG: TonB-dependent receptor plug domain-containing protein, partial [Betaproteobacteria bacterium]